MRGLCQRGAVDPVEAAIGGYPKTTRCAAVADAADDAVGANTFLIETNALKRFSAQVEFVCAFVRSNPENASPVLVKRADKIITQAVRLAGLGEKPAEFPGFFLQ